jgi:hypothetical protein
MSGDWEALINGDFTLTCREGDCLALLPGRTSGLLYLSHLLRYAEDSHGWHQGRCPKCALRAALPPLPFPKYETNRQSI